MKKVINVVIIILIIFGIILLYPFKVSVDKDTKKTTCSNLLGMKYNCNK